MNMGIKGRIRKIKSKVSPSNYKLSDDLFIELDLLARIETLTADEAQTLEALQHLPLHPELVATLDRLESSK